MKYEMIGKSKLNASIIGFGTWGISGDFNKVNNEDMVGVLKEAYNLGVNFFDTAPAYGFGHSEKLVGKALNNIRDRVLIATKCGAVRDEKGAMKLDLSRESIKKEIDDSLKRLRTDYVDLYQVHWPDPNTTIEETFLTLNDLKKAGKIRYIGVCNYSVELLEEAMRYSEIISTQNLYNIIQRNSDKFYSVRLTYHTEEEILPFCKKKKLGFFPFAPFCQGLLTGKKLKVEDFDFKDNDHRKYNLELSGEKLRKNINLVKRLLKVSRKINKPLTQMVLNWLIKDKRITSIIVGPMKESEVRDNIETINWALDNRTYMKINNLIARY